jgi:hypothetical protein
MSAAFAIFIEATVIASEAKQSMVLASKYGLLRRGAYHRSRDPGEAAFAHDDDSDKVASRL